MHPLWNNSHIINFRGKQNYSHQFFMKIPKIKYIITARLILHYICISYLYLDLERKKKNFQAKNKSIFQLSLSTPKCYSSTSLITSIKDHQSCPFLKNNDFLREHSVSIFVGTGALFRNERPWLPTKFMVYLHWWQQSHSGLWGSRHVSQSYVSGRSDPNSNTALTYTGF